MATLTSYVLDTNIVLALLRNNQLGKAVDQAYALSGSLSRNFVCVVSVGELLSLAELAKWAAQKRSQLEASLQELVWIDINDRLVLDAYASIDSYSLSIGRTMGKNDLWIAASAAVTGAIRMTTDKDFNHLHPDRIQRILIDPAFGKINEAQ
jgi:tRNA(fMet)-specific endonuclease VapC